jgi:AcrR family transcriptional regulator
MPSAGQPQDRRVQRTRRLLLDSVRELMAERGYERLTIQNILDHAGVGRATFYAHFSSKDQLLEESIAGLRGWLLHTAASRPPQRLGISLPFFEHLDSHRSIYRTTVARRGEVTVGRLIRRLLRDLVRDDLAAHAGLASSGPPAEMVTEFIVGALWSTIVWWIGTESTLPPAEVDRAFRTLVFSGMPGTAGDVR